MRATKIALNLVQVASPCTAPWDEMAGNERVRLCGECDQHIYNLSALTRAEAEALILSKEGKLCVRFYRRADGTMMTQDCPIGWRAVKMRMAWIGGIAATAFLALFSLLTVGVLASIRGNGNGGLRLVNPVERIHDQIFPPEQLIMGECLPLENKEIPGKLN